MMKVSIIVPVYNIAALLGRCLDSVLSQTYTCWECICVNDGSSDDSGKVLDDYAAKDARFKVIHQQNAGVSAARNAGIKSASGEYITFVDGDDYVASDFLNKMVAAASHPSAPGIVASGYWECDESGKLLFEVKPTRNIVFPDFPQMLTALHVDQRIPFSCMKLYRKSVIKQHGLSFDENCFVGEDTIFDFKYLMHVTSISYVNEGGYMYCRREGSATSTVSRGQMGYNRYKNITRCFLKLYDELSHVEVLLPRFHCYALAFLIVSASCKIVWHASKQRDCIFRLWILFLVLDTMLRAMLNIPVALWGKILHEAYRLRSFRKKGNCTVSVTLL